MISVEHMNSKVTFKQPFQRGQNICNFCLSWKVMYEHPGVLKNEHRLSLIMEPRTILSPVYLASDWPVTGMGWEEVISSFALQALLVPGCQCSCPNSRCIRCCLHLNICNKLSSHHFTLGALRQQMKMKTH